MADSITVTSAAPVSLTVTVSSAASTTITAPASSSLSVTNKGPKGDTGDQGPQGIQGLPGLDGSDGQGVPTGGVADQIIVKQSATDYDTAWDYIQTITEAVKNVSGGPLDKGTPVHVTGSTGNTVEVIAADAATNYPAHLILNEDLADEAEGRGVALGFINNVDVPDASIYTEGQTVYLGASGGWTTTKPTGTNAIQNLGVIVKVNTSGNKISGVVLGAGRANDVPNLPSGKFFIGSATYTSESAYTLPTSDGTTGQLLQTDGAGAVSFVDFSGSPWTTSGSDIYYTTGNVGVGTTTPSEPLHVSGTARIDDDLLIIDSGQGANNGILITSNPSNYVSEHSHVSVRIGHSAGQQLAASAQKNVAIGNSALERSTASYNIALGFRTAKGMNGGYNVAIGDFAGNQNFSPVTNPRNVILGYQAGQQSTSGDNVVIGYDSGRHTSGGQNVTIGGSAGLGTSGTSTFSNTVAVGYQALTALTTGAGNTAVGYQAGTALTTGSSNTLFGQSAGGSLTTASYNTIIGTGAGASSGSTKQGRTIVGASAGQYNNGDNNVILGFGALQYSSASNSVAIGQQAAHIGGGSNAVHIGRQAGRNTSGNNNVTIGYEAGLGVQSSSTYENTVAVGYQALTALTTGVQNTAVGYQAGDSITTTSYNTLLGYQAGQGVSSPTGLVAIGSNAGKGGPSYSTFVGASAGNNITGQDNTAIGFQALNLSTGSGTGNVAIGRKALGGTGQMSSNVAIGQNAGVGYGNKSNNVLIGHASGSSLTTGSSNVLIGYTAGNTLTTESNKLYIENSNSTTPLIYGEFDNDILRVNGTLQVNDPSSTGYAFPTATGTLGQVLEVDASGDLVFATPSGGGSSSQIISHTGGRLQVTTGTDNAATGISLFGNQGVMHDEIFAGLTVGSNLPASGIGTPGTTTVSNMFNSTVPATFQYAGAAGTARFVLSLKNAFFNVGYNTGTLPTFRFFLLRLDSAGKTAIANGTVPTSYTGELVASATWTPANTSQWWNAGSVVESSNGVSIAEDDLLVACCLCDATVSSTQYLYINSFKIFVD